MFISFGFAVFNFDFDFFRASIFLLFWSEKNVRPWQSLWGWRSLSQLGPSVHASFIWETGPWTINQLSNFLPKWNHHQSRKRCWEQKLLFNVIKKISVENSFHCIPFPTALSFENKDSTLSPPQAWPKAYLPLMCHLNSTNFRLPAVSLTLLIRSTGQGYIC